MGVGLEYEAGPTHRIFLDVRGEYGLPRIRNYERNGESNTGLRRLSAGRVVSV